ncbi:MAG: hypothetical protein KDA84_26535, partial [Planctomycetaceae bacterium]|nr:hypothetical protein [Planctomycetaceae bacterium]
YRTVVIVPVQHWLDLRNHLLSFRDVLQTAVLAAPPTQWRSLVNVLAYAGITQVTAPGSAAARFLGLPHEGEFSLRRLIKLVGVDLGIGPLTCPNRPGSYLVDISEALSDSQ